MAGTRVRFFPDAAPALGQPGSADHEQLGAIQLAHFARAIQPGDVVADVGAYRGEYTVVAAVRTGSSGRVVAFEPTVANIAFIERSCRLNNVRAVVDVVPMAASDSSGLLRFYAFGSSSTNSLIAGATQGDDINEVMIPCTTLDEYFRNTRLPAVVKIDVEGGEWRVLRGAERIVRSDAVIYCELHPYAWQQSGDDAAAMRAWLAERNRLIVDIVTGELVTEWRYGPVLLQTTW